MADIIHEFSVKAHRRDVYRMFSTPDGLNKWWTQESSEDTDDQTFQLQFGPKYHWQAKVTRRESPAAFELQMTQAHPDWLGTRVGCDLWEERDKVTRVRFYHSGWPEQNEHWRGSSFCWAMYLRLLRRHLEFCETVDYEKRLEV